MYGTTGVCEIDNIGTPDFAEEDDERLYYFLDPVYQNGTIYAPIDNEKVTVRKLIEKDEAEKLLQDIETIEPHDTSGKSMQQLTALYQSAIDSSDVNELLRLIKFIYGKNTEAILNNKKVGQIDKRFMKKAEELLYGEIATTTGKDIDTVEEVFHEKLDSIFPCE